MDHQDDKFSYSEYLTNPQWYDLFDYLCGGIDPGMVHTTMQLNYQMSCHERAGKRVYQLSPDLAVQMKHTELRNVLADDLRLPFESIYIMVPPEAQLKIWNSETGWHKAIGIYITEERHMAEMDEYLKGGKSGTLRGWRMMIVGQDKAECTQATGDDTLSFFRILFKEGTKLTDILETARREIQWDMENNPFCTWDERMNWDWEQQFRWAMNVVLYATWEEPGEHWIANKEARKLWDRIGKLPPNSKKRKNLQRKFQTIDKQKRIQLGAKIVINRRKGTSEDSEGKSGKTETDETVLRVKTRISGHWKRVVHGKGRTERRIQWIEPHWRNLDGLTPARSPRHELR